jgi:MYXO-CTERM domain-containing protein
MLRSVLVSLASLAAFSPFTLGTALAQDIPPPDGECPVGSVGCNESDELMFQHRDALFDDVMLDSGWVPADSPIQVRFAVFLGGSTEVDLAGRAHTYWPAPLEAYLEGTSGAGRFAINYGLEIIAQIRIDVEIAGIRYRWEGDIPIPGGIPSDLRLAAETTFDPFLLPPIDPRPVMVWDDTDVVTLFEYDVTDSLIPIPGIGGGFRADVALSLDGSYQTDRIVLSDASPELTEEGMTAIVDPDEGRDDFGAAKDYTVLPHGTIAYAGHINFYPTLFLEFAGRTFDVRIAEIPLQVVDLDAATDFNTEEVHVPLPDVRVDPSSIAFGEVELSGAGEALLTVHNDGEAELTVGLIEPPDPFSISTPSLRVPPHSSVRLGVFYAPATPGEDSALLLLSTNDPDQPFLEIPLTGGARGTVDPGEPDAGVGGDGGPGSITDGGCGCRSAGTGANPGPVAMIGAVLVSVVLMRRRRSA